MSHFKENFVSILISLTITALLFYFKGLIPFLSIIDAKIYGEMLKIEHKIKPLPPQINDMMLVTIDNKSLNAMPLRFPYPRRYFAQVIDNLEKAGAKVIGIDFVFMGESFSKEDDAQFKHSLAERKNIVLASAINENGLLDLRSMPSLTANTSSGIVTKMVGPDGVIRRNLTYLIGEKDPHQGFLSWEMQILKTVKNIDLASLTTDDFYVSFKNNAHERWDIPVEPSTKSFLVHFRANTVDFSKISFVDAYNNKFDPALVNNKIVLIGTASLLLQDIQLTPFGWLPGLTLNANAFLTLYAHDFLKEISDLVQFIVVLLGVIISCLLFVCFSRKKAIFLIGMEGLSFFLISYALLNIGYIWNYSFFPLSIIICPYLGRRCANLFIKKK